MTRGPVDVEGLLVGILPGASTRVPKQRPNDFTRVTRAGGTTLNIVQSRPRVLVECWGSTSEAAFARAATAYRAIADLARKTTAGVWVAEVELTEPVNFPDDDRPRYQFVAQLTTSLQEAS